MTTLCSVSEFWQRLELSRLISADRMIALREAFGGLAGAEQANAVVIAEWLQSQGAITDYHSHVLLSGQTGPFEFGEYRIHLRVPGGELTRRMQSVHMPTDHPVTLHFLIAEPSAEDWRKGEQYAERHAKCQHVNLDTCYHTFLDRGQKIAVTESVLGETLSDCLQQTDSIPYPEAAAIMQQVVSGVAALHDAGLIHGQLSAASICLQDNGHVKVSRHPLLFPAPINFDAPDPKGRRLASANYFAPELARPGTPTNPLADIYALGCVFYELLVGRPPFAGGKFDEKMQRHATERIGSLQESFGVPGELQRIIEFMLAKDASIRSADCHAIAQQIAPFASHGTTEPLSHPTEKAYRSWIGNRRAASAVAQSSAGFVPRSKLDSISRNPSRGLTEGPSVLPSRPVAESHDIHRRSGDEPSGIAVVAATSSAMARRRASGKVSPLAIGLGAVTLASLFAVGFVLTRSTDGGSDTSDSPINAEDDSPSAGISSGERASRIPASVARQASVSSEPIPPVATPSADALWANPAVGVPVNLEWTPSASQLYLVMRPDLLMQTSEGGRALQAMGPELESRLSELASLIGVSLLAAKQVVVSFVPQDVGAPQVVTCVRLPKGQTFTAAKWGSAESRANGPVYTLAGKRLFLPSPDFCVVGPAELVDAISDSPSSGATLRRDFESLRQQAKNDSHVAILFAPSFLAADGQLVLSGPYQALRKPLLEFLGRDASAGLVSFNLGSTFFGEMRLAGPVEMKPRSVAAELTNKISDLPTQVDQLLSTNAPSSYWENLAERFPEMLRFAASQAKVGIEDKQVVANFALPQHAAHNLLLASELTMTALTGTSRPQAAAKVQSNLDQILAKSVDFDFAQQSLEFAMQNLVELLESQGESDFSIVIQGNDLQLEGITRNQQIRQFSAEATAVADVLTQLVMRANSVTTVTSPSQVDQKLVWLMAPPEAGSNVIWITTRTAAERKGYALPPVFVTP